MKTKIAFVTNQFIMGGIEKSLISLLKKLPSEKYDITVFVHKNGGDLLHEVPSNVNIKCIFGNEKTMLEKVINYLKAGKLSTALKTIYYTCLLRKGSGSSHEENVLYTKMLPQEKTKFDLAIAYYIPASLSVLYVVNNLQSKLKAAWIHGDVTQYKNSLPKYKSAYTRYDNIFGVSHYTVNKFVEVFPHLKDRTTLFYNVIDKENMKNMAFGKKVYDNSDDQLKLLTVGRLELEKGQDIIPKVLDKLFKEGYNIQWYCIGDGSLRSQMEREIKEKNLGNNLFLLGTKDNPYPYIKECDLYVQTSRHEAYCITVAEARAFHKPIITTDTAASEQIVHKKTGLVVPFDENKLYKAVKQMLDDEQLRDSFKRNLRKDVVNTTTEMEKFYQLTKEIS